MSTVTVTSLWAAFGADGCAGETRTARTLRTLAGFIDRHPELDNASVEIDGQAGLVSFWLNNTGLDLAARVEAVGLLAAALDAQVETHTYPTGQAIVRVYAHVADDRRVTVNACVAKPCFDAAETAVA